MDIEQGILLEGYAQFVSKVEQRPELTGEDAKKWLMGDLMQQGFQVSFHLRNPSTRASSAACCDNALLRVTADCQRAYFYPEVLLSTECITKIALAEPALVMEMLHSQRQAKLGPAVSLSTGVRF